MDYTTYSTDDFMADESFQASVMGTDPAAIDFWQAWLLQHPAKAREAHQAAAVLAVLASGQRQLPAATLREAETAKFWASIQLYTKDDPNEQ